MMIKKFFLSFFLITIFSSFNASEIIHFNKNQPRMNRYVRQASQNRIPLTMQQRKETREVLSTINFKKKGRSIPLSPLKQLAIKAEIIEKAI